MSRVIKFRAWDKALRVMVYASNSTIFYREEFNESIIMQFTGLHDKNGKEIYEGDILRIHDPQLDDGMGQNYEYCVVEFKSGGFTVEYDFGDFDMSTIGWAIDMWAANDTTCEVIGNIYENKNLLSPCE